VRAHAGERIRVDDDVDDISALRHADLLITDISSRAFNFMLLDKPVVAFCPDEVFVDRLDRERVEPIRQGAHLARSAGEVEVVVAHLLGHARGDV
jgi:CDP-glycerol glycerophosphotransferase (TagB/SpsB family)